MLHFARGTGGGGWGDAVTDSRYSSDVKDGGGSLSLGGAKRRRKKCCQIEALPVFPHLSSSALTATVRLCTSYKFLGASSSPFLPPFPFLPFPPRTVTIIAFPKLGNDLFARSYVNAKSGTFLFTELLVEDLISYRLQGESATSVATSVYEVCVNFLEMRGCDSDGA